MVEEKYQKKNKRRTNVLRLEEEKEERCLTYSTYVKQIIAFILSYNG